MDFTSPWSPFNSNPFGPIGSKSGSDVQPQALGLQQAKLTLTLSELLNLVQSIQQEQQKLQLQQQQQQNQQQERQQQQQQLRQNQFQRKLELSGPLTPFKQIQQQMQPLPTMQPLQLNQPTIKPLHQLAKPTQIQPQLQQQTSDKQLINLIKTSRLHVSNIPFRYRREHLARMFSQFGIIIDSEVIFNERGSKGFGFVSFARVEDAERAKRAFDGMIIDQRKIEVNYATPKPRKTKRSTSCSTTSS